MPFSTTCANSVLAWMFGKGTLSTNSKVYIGLCSNDPEATNGTFTELSGGAYARVLVSAYNNTYPDYMSTPANREIKNSKQINWVKATADLKPALGFGLFTTETGGSPFYYGTLKTPVTCTSGEVALFDPQTLRIQIATTDEEIT